MSNFHIEGLKAQIGDYARPYLFYVSIDELPPGLNDKFFTVGGASDRMGNMEGRSNQRQFLVRSTSLPASQIDQIPIAYQGLTYKIGSTHTFADWSCTYNIDGNSDIRHFFLQWASLIHNPITNRHCSPSRYFGKVFLSHVNGHGQTIQEYKLIGAWPSTVGEVSLDYSEKGNVASFQVTFQYQWHEIKHGGKDEVLTGDTGTHKGDAKEFSSEIPEMLFNRSY